MTGSWDKTLKFWDTRSPTPIITMNTGEKVYCADVMFPMAIVSTAERGILVYQLNNQPSEYKVPFLSYYDGIKIRTYLRLLFICL